MIDIICKECSKQFQVRNYRKNTAKFCSFHCNMLNKWKFHKMGGFKKGSIPWNKGKKVRLSPNTEFKKGMTPWNKSKKGVQIAWNKGTKGLMKNSNRGKLIPAIQGEKHWNWKGGISEKNALFRNSGPYREWRRKVFQRDMFSCVKCGYRSHKRKDIRADHIKPFSLYPELRLVVDNGRTLCLPCDLKYGWRYKGSRHKKKVSN